ncbi:hypothetical protein [Protofrankia symbiont of Coriaria ruscifolia]|uniref:hypothetical protein n=1 Tax=Protofrankia symbiont of Coriaria ruscifolia TaxID=1306542 RepID=UPI001A94B148|nr:hypothetical protein [Protofrankia symbiont of Coriaria ruscifolia]
MTAAAGAGWRVDVLTEYLDADGPEGRQEQMLPGQDGRWRLILTGQPIPPLVAGMVAGAPVW